jgi:hypothetical protein
MGEAEGGDKIEEGEDTAAPPRTKPAAHAHTRRRGERERSRVVEREREGEGARATRRRAVYLYVGFEEPCKRGERRRRDAFTPGLPPSLQWFWLLAEVCGLANAWRAVAPCCCRARRVFYGARAARVVVVVVAGLIVFQVEARQWAAGAVSLTAFQAKGGRGFRAGAPSSVLQATALAKVLPQSSCIPRRLLRLLRYFTVFLAKFSTVVPTRLLRFFTW